MSDPARPNKPLPVPSLAVRKSGHVVDEDSGEDEVVFLSASDKGEEVSPERIERKPSMSPGRKASFGGSMDLVGSLPRRGTGVSAVFFKLEVSAKA